MTNPLITIITPSYNLGKYIDKAVESVLDQDYKNFEYLVIDGGSTDNTLEILKKYSNIPEYKNKFSWISENDKGQTNAINKGLKMARGQWFAWLNADDYYEKNALTTVAETIKSNPEAAVIYGNCKTHGKKVMDNIPPATISFRTLINGNVIFGPSSFFNKKFLLEEGGFDEELDLWMDYDMYMRLSKKHKFVYINELLAHFVERDNQKSHSDDKKLEEEARYVNMKNQFPLLTPFFKLKYHI